MRRLPIALGLTLASGCVYPNDLFLTPPQVEGARAAAIAKLDEHGATLETYNLETAENIELTFGARSSSTLSVAVLFYTQTLSELRIPEGSITIPDTPSSEGDPLPFEHGFITEIRKNVDPWQALTALPAWLENVRIPSIDCPMLVSDPRTFGELDDHLTAFASDGTRAMAFTLGPLGARTFVLTGTATTERPGLFTGDVVIHDAIARPDGRIITLVLDRTANLTHLYSGTATGPFILLGTLRRRIPDPELEVGRSSEDRDDIFILTGVGELLRFDGRNFVRLRERNPLGGSDERFRMAWVAPQTVVMFGPENAARTLTRFSPNGASETEPLQQLTAFSLTYLPERGTLLGTTSGELLRLDGDRWEPVLTADIFNRSLLSAAIYKGQLSTGGTVGVFVWRRESNPCLEVISGTSLTALLPFGDGLIAANRDLGETPSVVVIE